MTAPSRLLGLDNERFGRAQKGWQDAVSASLGLTTSYQPFITYTGGVVAANGGQWLDAGNAPNVDVLVAFTHGGTATTLSLLAVLAQPPGGDATQEPTVGAPIPYIPADTDGTTPVFVNEISFTTTNWSTTTSPLSSVSVKYVRANLKLNGRRLVALYAKADSATGSPTAVVYVSAGTQE